MKELNIKILVLEKLKLQSRGAKLILQNKDLCKRILNETPIWEKKFAQKYDISLSKVILLRKQKYFSSFTNTNKRGSKVFIFEEEAANIFSNIMYSGYVRLDRFDMVVKYILDISSAMLNERENNIMKMIFYDRFNFDKIASLYNLSHTRINQIFHKSLRKIRSYKKLISNYDELMSKYIALKMECEWLSKHINDLKAENKIEYKKLNPYKLKILNTQIKDMDMSLRLYNCLKAHDIITLGDIIQYERHDFLKFRNFGKKSLKELDEILVHYEVCYGMKKFKITTNDN